MMSLGLIVPGSVVALVAAIASLFAGYSVWVALGIYFVAGNLIALALIGLFALRTANRSHETTGVDRAQAARVPVRVH